MISLTSAETLPLEIDADGVVRVGKTRVSLDTIILAFTDGATAEEIAQQYPSLQLADIYSVIGHYLRHPSEVEAYLGQRAHEAEHVRHQNEARSDTSGVRDRLLARRANPAPRAVRGSPPASPPQLALGSAKAAKGTEGYVEGDG